MHMYNKDQKLKFRNKFKNFFEFQDKILIQIQTKYTCNFIKKEIPNPYLGFYYIKSRINI